MTNLTIGKAPVLVPQLDPGDGWSVQNLGPGNVYLGNGVDVSPGNGFLVPQGTAVTLIPGNTFYAISDNVATLSNASGITANSANIIAGTVNATISGPVSLSAGQVVGVSGIASVVTVQGIVQTEPTNYGVQLYNNSIGFPGTSGATTSRNFSVPDASAYSSYVIVISGSGTGNPTMNLAGGGLSDQWALFAPGFNGGVATLQPIVTGYGHKSIQAVIAAPVQATGPTTWTLQTYNAASYATYFMQVTVYGMYAAVAPQVSFVPSLQFNPGSGNALLTPGSIIIAPAGVGDYVAFHDSRAYNIAITHFATAAYTADVHASLNQPSMNFTPSNPPTLTGASITIGYVGSSSLAANGSVTDRVGGSLSQIGVRVFNSGANTSNATFLMNPAESALPVTFY